MKESPSDIKRLLAFSKPYKFYLILSLLAAVGVAIATTLNAHVLQMLVDDVLTVPSGVEARSYYASRLGNLYFVIACAVGVTALKGSSSFAQTYMMSWICQKITLKIKVDFFDRLQKLPLNFYSSHRTGDLISRLNGDVVVVEGMLKEMTKIIADPLIIICVIGYMFTIYWELGLVIFLIIPVLAFVVKIISRRLRKVGQQLQDKIGDISSIIQESVLGIKIIKSFGMEKEHSKRFELEAEENFTISMKSIKYNALNSPIVELFDSFGVAVMLYFGSKGVIDGRITPGDLIGFLTALGLMFHPIKKITNGNGIIQQSRGALARIFEILDSACEEDLGTREVPKDAKINLEFQNLDFSFTSDRRVLKNINLKVDEGEVIALVGQSGGGKTSLVNLIPRFYKWQSGSILLDGIDIREYKLDSYRKLFGIVPQEVILFKGSITDNVCFGRPNATQDEVMSACKSANAHDFIMSLKNGYNTEISEMGVGLSGGQRQRIAIARSILKDPKILILDEATSALDNQSEKIVQQALDCLMKGRTTFVIAHRLSTVVNASRIIVLQDGDIKAIGTHQELLNSSDTYSKLYHSSESK
ncbi:MAG: ABC transporter ATP-binding protein [Candidatus Cloacimonadota bacterium]|nr:MAG: ABC transporter ATP-binding protein [Candidatus Cloacimonadota bacterium]